MRRPSMGVDPRNQFVPAFLPRPVTVKNVTGRPPRARLIEHRRNFLIQPSLSLEQAEPGQHLGQAAVFAFRSGGFLRERSVLPDVGGDQFSGRGVAARDRRADILRHLSTIAPVVHLPSHPVGTGSVSDTPGSRRRAVSFLCRTRPVHSTGRGARALAVVDGLCTGTRRRPWNGCGCPGRGLGWFSHSDKTGGSLARQERPAASSWQIAGVWISAAALLLAAARAAADLWQYLAR